MIKTGLLEQVVALNKLVTRLNPGQFVPSVDAETLGCLTAFYLSKQIEDSTQVVLLREQISAVLRICSGKDQVESSEDDAVLKAIERILKPSTCKHCAEIG